MIVLHTTHEYLISFQTIVRKLFLTDWHRLEYYAHKIRNLTIQGSDGTVDKRSFIALATYRPVRNPFPNLRRITLAIFTTLAYESVPYIDFLLTPNILEASVTFAGLDSTREVSLLLPSIARLCPNLEDLDVDNELTNNLDVESAVFQATCSMHSLRTLDLGFIEPPNGMIGRILYHLGSMISLETLHGLYIPTEIQSLDKPDLILPPPLGMVNHWFPKLRDLSLSLQDLDSAVLIVDSMQHLPFRSPTFYLNGQHQSPRKLLQSSAGNPQLPFSLSTLVILGDTEHTLVHNVGNAEIPSIFWPLLALTNLRKLTLRFSEVETLDDAWLIGHPNVSRSFGPCRSAAMRLRLINVSLVLKSFNTRGALPAGLCNEHITMLDCSASSIGSSIESLIASIFRCLILMFPNLCLLLIPWNFPSEGARKSWTDLQQLVRESQKY